MSHWTIGMLLVAGAIVVAAIKSEFQTRVILVLVLIAIMMFGAMRKKR